MFKIAKQTPVRKISLPTHHVSKKNNDTAIAGPSLARARGAAEPSPARYPTPGKNDRLDTSLARLAEKHPPPPPSRERSASIKLTFFLAGAKNGQQGNEASKRFCNPTAPARTHHQTATAVTPHLTPSYHDVNRSRGIIHRQRSGRRRRRRGSLHSKGNSAEHVFGKHLNLPDVVRVGGWRSRGVWCQLYSLWTILSKRCHERKTCFESCRLVRYSTPR
jgi:hypothetical protein